jgi:hypothetical protein
VEKDITRYSSLLKQPQTMVVKLANVVDKTYNVTISIQKFVSFVDVPLKLYATWNM